MFSHQVFFQMGLQRYNKNLMLQIFSGFSARFFRNCMINVTFVTLEPELIILMDIDLLSKMVRQLILEHDKVFLPGLGAFVAEIVPSTFSDKGYTVNPPYRRLSFRIRACSCRCRRKDNPGFHHGTWQCP